MTPRARTALLTVVLTLAAAGSATAAPTAVTIVGGDLAVVGDDTAETYSIALTTDAMGVGTAKVTGPSGFNGFTIPTCSKTDTTFSCPTSTAHGIRLETKGQDDVINEDSNYPLYELFQGMGPRNRVDAGAGNDTLNARVFPLTPADTGGEGNDTFNGLTGTIDQFVAGPGNDTYRGDALPVTVPFTHGFPFQLDLFSLDRLDAVSTPNGITVTLDDVANDDFGAGGIDDVGADVELLNGSNFDDTITAGDVPVYVFGNGGKDHLIGSPGDDTLEGDNGDDIVAGGAGDDVLNDGDDEYDVYADTGTTLPAPGNDSLDGGPGADTLFSGTGTDDLHGGDGTDMLVAGRYDLQVVDTSAPGFVEPAPRYTPLTISLDDVANDGATGSAEHDNVHTDIEGVDTASRLENSRPASAADTVTGSAAANEIITGGGADTVDGGAGADVIDTGGGDDTVAAVDQHTDAIRCGDGADSVTADLPGLDPARADVLTDCETVTGTALPAALTTVIVAAQPHRPVVTLTGRRTVKTKTFKRRRTLTATVGADQAYAASGAALTRGGHIARLGELVVGTGRLASGTGTRTLTVKVAKAYAKRLTRKLRTKRQRRKGVKIDLAVTVSNAAGQSTRATRTYTVKG